jgi:hypothetical protein
VCTEAYVEGDWASSMVHLANNAIQKYADNYDPDANMWHSSKLATYLDTACDGALFE